MFQGKNDVETIQLDGERREKTLKEPRGSYITNAGKRAGEERGVQRESIELVKSLLDETYGRCLMAGGGGGIVIPRISSELFEDIRVIQATESALGGFRPRFTGMRKYADGPKNGAFFLPFSQKRTDEDDEWGGISRCNIEKSTDGVGNQSSDDDVSVSDAMVGGETAEQKMRRQSGVKRRSPGAQHHFHWRNR